MTQSTSVPGPDSPLRAAFLAALPESLKTDAAAMDDLDARLAERLAAARAAWPAVPLDVGLFAAHLAERVPPDLPLDRGLRMELAPDLYLACACAQGEPAAIAAFEARYLHDLDGALGHLDLAPTLVGEVKQIVREKLLVRDGEGAGPKIADYGGRGDLSAWVRVIAVRVALGILRRTRREVAFEDEALADVPAATDDPELAHLKSLYREEFGTAFGEALRGLTHRQRNLLRHHFLHGLSIDQIGGLYRVHRATAARWIAKARETLWTETRRRLTERLHVGRDELDSIMRLIQSRLDMSIHELLSTTSGGK